MLTDRQVEIQEQDQIRDHQAHHDRVVFLKQILQIDLDTLLIVAYQIEIGRY